jgi:HAD superfamily hydrolase (TIGR01450 family)
VATGLAPLSSGTPKPLVTRHDVALLDLDGVLYIGPDAVPGAPAAVAQAARAGLRPAYVTNNASRTPATVAAHLTALGVPAEESDVVTSAQAVATLVAGRVPAGSRVLVVGGEGLCAALVERGLEPTSSAEGAAAVVQGFAPDVSWALLAEGAYAVTAGLPWLASNLDATIPTPRGIAPGNGALVEVIAGATGRRPDAVAGKPETPLHDEAVRRTGARDPIVVGDRLDTDIEGANRTGYDSLLVMTGVTGLAELVGAPAEQRPTYVAPDLGGLARQHDEPAQSNGVVTCGGWQAAVVDGALRVDGTGAPDAWWQVAATAGWAHLDTTGTAADVSAVLPPGSVGVE